MGHFPWLPVSSPLVTQGRRRVKTGKEVAFAKAAWNRFSMESAEVGEPPMSGEGVWKDFWGRVWALDQGVSAAWHKGGREGVLLKGQQNKGIEPSAGPDEGLWFGGEKWRWVPLSPECLGEQFVSLFLFWQLLGATEGFRAGAAFWEESAIAVTRGWTCRFESPLHGVDKGWPRESVCRGREIVSRRSLGNTCL